MSESLNKESSGDAQESAPCPRCLKPYAKDLKFTISSWFQTDPGDGLSRWQECCKCGIEEAAVDDDLPFSQSRSGSHIIKLPPGTDAEAKDGRWANTEGATDLASWSELAHQITPEHAEAANPTLTVGTSEGPKVGTDESHLKGDENSKGQEVNTTEHASVSATATDGARLSDQPTNAPEVSNVVDAPPHETAVDSSSPQSEKGEDEDDYDEDKDEVEEEYDDEPEQEPELVRIKPEPGQEKEQRQEKERPKKQEEAQARDQVQVQNDAPGKEPPASGTKYDGRSAISPMKPTYLPQPAAEAAKQNAITGGAWSSGPTSQSYMIGGRYEVDSVIGKGTFGPTYKARDVATGKLLCLKMVSTPISRHRRVVKRILQEVEKCKTLNHAHIVAIYDSAIDKSGRPFYVMDLLEQGSLKQAIKQEGFLDVPEVLDIFLDVCEALSYAHEHGILHRDLKPSNILLEGQEPTRRAKVADFGIIKALPSLGSEALEMTQSTDVFADPSCMSPEQCLGRRLDVRSDIYSLGCSMYEAIIGKRVFTGPNPLSVVVQHFKAAPRSFDSVMYNCDIQADVEAVVMKMLEKSPENRYQEVSQVVEDLRLLKAHKKPSYAYQKKKVARSLMLPFGAKEDPNSAEKLFDLVLHNKNGWNEKEAWSDDPKPQIAADIERLSKNSPDNAGRRQKMRVVPGHNTNDVIAEIKIAEARRSAPAEAKPKINPSPDELWIPDAKKRSIAENNDAVDRINAAEAAKRQERMKMIPMSPPPMSPPPMSPPSPSQPPKPQSPESPNISPQMASVGDIKKVRRELAEMQERLREEQKEAERQKEQAGKVLMPIRRMDEFEESSVSLFVDEDDDDLPIVTVEQAKREIPDYLLQISRSSGASMFGASALIAIIIVLASVVLIWAILKTIHPY